MHFKEISLKTLLLPRQAFRYTSHIKSPFYRWTRLPGAPSTPNAFKFERFIFDLMPLADSVTVIEIDPAEGFAPLKIHLVRPKTLPKRYSRQSMLMPPGISHELVSRCRQIRM